MLGMQGQRRTQRVPSTVQNLYYGGSFVIPVKGSGDYADGETVGVVDSQPPPVPHGSVRDDGIPAMYGVKCDSGFCHARILRTPTIASHRHFEQRVDILCECTIVASILGRLLRIVTDDATLIWPVLGRCNKYRCFVDTGIVQITRPDGDPDDWMGRQVRSMSGVTERTLLTHLGRVRADGTFVFAETPKWRELNHDPWVEVDISMLHGRHSVEHTAKRVRRMTAPLRQRRKDAVRYFDSYRLLENRYYPMATPTSNIPEHVSVYGDMAAIEAACPDGATAMIYEPAHRAWWESDDRVTLVELELERVAADATD
ncbi:hypothetical protein [Rhodococcoides navarretei]|uniref:Uncharacterized protein n=1 Tax=Rhodococcus navarretei TaxID=3128981 RepID=A0ABU9CSQ1_9NOCA